MSQHKTSPKIVNGTITCTMCKVPKDVEEFSKTARNVIGRMHACKQCNADRTLFRLCLIDSYFKHVAANLRHIAATRDLAFNLGWEYLKEMYEKQDGKCFYTQAEMRTVRGQGQSKLSLSVDKVIPERGYIKGNIVLVTKRANLIKNDITLAEMRDWMPGWYEKLEAHGYAPKQVA
jgi:hypothetical protein